MELKDALKQYYNVLNKAMKERRKVKIDYYSYTQDVKARVIHPLELFLYSTGWVCVAFCELRQDLRHFELKRISKIELLNEKILNRRNISSLHDITNVRRFLIWKKSLSI